MPLNGGNNYPNCSVVDCDPLAKTEGGTIAAIYFSAAFVLICAVICFQEWMRARKARRNILSNQNLAAPLLPAPQVVLAPAAIPVLPAPAPDNREEFRSRIIENFDPDSVSSNEVSAIEMSYRLDVAIDTLNIKRINPRISPSYSPATLTPEYNARHSTNTSLTPPLKRIKLNNLSSELNSIKRRTKSF